MKIVQIGEGEKTLHTVQGSASHYAIFDPQLPSTPARAWPHEKCLRGAAAAEPDVAASLMDQTRVMIIVQIGD